MEMNRKLFTIIFSAAAIGIITVVMVMRMTGSGWSGEARAASATGAEETAAVEPVRVEVTQPVRRALSRLLRMPATLAPGETADLFAKTSGYVATIAVDIGSPVEKGEQLLTIDVPEMTDELHQAQAVLAARRAKVEALAAKAVQAESMTATARAEVQRYTAEHDLWKITLQRKRQLLEERAIPLQDFDEAKSRLAVVEAQVRIAKARVGSAEAEKQAVDADVSVARSEVAVAEARVARLETLMQYRTIRAPFDGVITDRFVDPGAFVRSAADGITTPLLTIANTSYIRLVLEIPESDTPFVVVGTEVEVDVKALGGNVVTAFVTRTAMALKTSTRTMRVEVDLDNKDGRFAPGMYAQVAVKLESKEQALIIPSKAIRVRGRDVSVLVADGTVVKSLPVEIGYDDGIWAEVISGLSGDEQIIVSATSAVAPGAPVKAVSVEASTNPGDGA
jgi:RND family efflux transporter MFP subunit